VNRTKTSYEKHGQLGIAFWLARDELWEVETTHVRPRAVRNAG
jgi:hypothetical protein